jgi:hypothetical protein
MIKETESEDHNRMPILDRRTRTITTSLILGGMILLAGYGFMYIIVQSISPGKPEESWFLSVLHKQYAATLGVPMSAVAALCIVLLLETAAGPIEIETPWLKFRGAAAPVIFWLFCFLVLTLALSWLWVKEPATASGKTEFMPKVPSQTLSPSTFGMA